MADNSRSPAVVLLIEDDPDCLDIYSQLLSRLWDDLQILTATTLAQALASLEYMIPDFIVADLRLPDSQPDATFAALLAWLPPRTPLIIISGYVTPLHGQEMLTLGADAFIPKGVHPREVQRIILETWFRHQGQQAREAPRAPHSGRL